jgi:small GTP-binding protein
MISQYKSRNLPIKYKIILIGDCNVGKTSLFYRYIKNEPLTKQQATIIDFRYKKIKITDKEVQLCIWDTAGQ